MSAALHAVVQTLVGGHAASESALEAAFQDILSGDADPLLIAAFLTALRMRGETVDDMVAGARILRERSRAVSAPASVIDTCGTGGLGWTSLNTSTAAAIVAAAAGASVAKHGNRSTPPKTGSADVLEALGVNLAPSDAQIARCFDEARVAFLFAPAHHSAMRHVAPVRRALGFRTVFNLLGPLANPARATRQVLGVASPDWLAPFAEALRRLGSERALVVHGLEGLDEISVSGPTRIAELNGAGVRQFEITPEDLGLPRHDAATLRGGDAASNAAAIRAVLDGEQLPFRDLVIANAGASLMVAGLASGLREGADLARVAIDDGRAATTLSRLVACSNG